jgi:hypothetical protein
LPAAYAHITLVNVLQEPQRLESIPGFPTAAISALLEYAKFCELGAVSPDYPYLAILSTRAKQWANMMHKEHTGYMIQTGARMLQRMTGEPKRKGLSWLLGYASHVIADATIHPIIEMKVGVYDRNKRPHRICEMHQDAYIFPKILNLGEIGLSEHLDSGIARCSDRVEVERLDRDIAHLWQEMLRAVYPSLILVNPPDLDKWHGWFRVSIDKIAEEGNRLLPIARHVAADIVGLEYPAMHEVESDYIEDLETPYGRMNYNDLFGATIENISRGWRDIAQVAMGSDPSQLAWIGNWDLDSGRNEEGVLVLWGRA